MVNFVLMSMVNFTDYQVMINYVNEARQYLSHD